MTAGADAPPAADRGPADPGATPASPASAERAALFVRYRDAAAALTAAVDEAPDLDCRPRGGGWTPRQVVHHVADSETSAYVRLRRLLAEDTPAIPAYDEEQFARRLHYDRPVEQSLAVVHAVRAASLELLERLDESEWRRAGSHPDHDRYGVEQWLRAYAEHPWEHAAQIRAAFG